MRRKRRQSTGASSEANSLNIRGGIPSGPYALFVLREQRALRTQRSEIIGGGIGLLRGSLGGGATLESSREELEEKREPKRLALSAGETAIA